MLKNALKFSFSSNGISITPKKTQRLLNVLLDSVLGGKVVLIVEQWPLNSMEAHGKFSDLNYQRVGNTGNQYSKKYRNSKNPLTPSRQTQRSKLADALHALQF